MLIFAGVPVLDYLYYTYDNVITRTPRVLLFILLNMQAYAEGISYPRNMLITYGRYGNEWWTGDATSSQFNCTPAQRASVLAYTLAVKVQHSYPNFSARDESGIVSFMLQNRNTLSMLIHMLMIQDGTE